MKSHGTFFRFFLQRIASFLEFNSFSVVSVVAHFLICLMSSSRVRFAATRIQAQFLLDEN